MSFHYLLLFLLLFASLSRRPMKMRERCFSLIIPLNSSSKIQFSCLFWKSLECSCYVGWLVWLNWHRYLLTHFQPYQNLIRSSIHLLKLWKSLSFLPTQLNIYSANIFKCACLTISSLPLVSSHVCFIDFLWQFSRRIYANFQRQISMRYVSIFAF